MDPFPELDSAFIPIYEVERSSTIRGAHIILWLRLRALAFALAESLPAWLRKLILRFGS
jgi:hypothetical protein